MNKNFDNYELLLKLKIVEFFYSGFILLIIPVYKRKILPRYSSVK